MMALMTSGPWSAARPRHGRTTHTRSGPRWRCRAGRCCRPAWSRFAGEREDLVGAQARDRTTAQVPNDPVAARLPGVGGAHDLDGVAFDDEFDLSVRQHAEPLPDA